MRVFQSPPPPPTCFFCLSTLSHSPRNPESFKCPHCLCWNRFDKTGQILSDEPAMRDESLNAASFAKRASPNKHRLPTSYSKGLFCHTCETNQLLLTNMLSNYLPSPEDPSYDTRVAEMPSYTASLQKRYPPVCKDCQPAVDEELRKKEHMARTTALGGWLKTSQHVGTQRAAETQRGQNDILLWKIRGALWVATLMSFIFIDLLGFLRYDLTRHWGWLTLLPSSVISLLWTFWDPTWLSARNARFQGRTCRVSGRERYVRCQMILWLSRIVTSGLIAFQWLDVPSYQIPSIYHRSWHTSALAVQVVLIILSLGTLRIHRPPTVRLLEPKPIRTDVTLDSNDIPRPGDPEPLISSLSLSNQSFTSSTEPVFGKPSFSPQKLSSDVSVEDMMDWSPINATPERVQDREGWMRPQRFFPPEQPTGLEDLFEKAKLDVEEYVNNEEKQRPTSKWNKKGGRELRKLGVFIAAAVAVALASWLAVYRV